MVLLELFDVNLNKNLTCILSFLLGIIFLPFLLLFAPSKVEATLDILMGEDGSEYIRSLESLRDLDYETWQVVVYKQGRPQGSTILRIVGYPGKLRIDHPTSLHVQSGRREWELEDVTLENIQLANDSREAAAEFELEPLLLDLTNNRPLRFDLDDVFNELPIPPYVVSEWRSLLNPPTKTS